MGSLTRRYILKSGVLTAVTGAVSQRVRPLIAMAAPRQLVICGWGGSYQEAQRKGIFEPFEKETGIKVVEASPTDYGKLKAMVLSGNVEWDVLVAATRMVLAGSKEGLLEPIDYQTVDTRDLFPEAVHKYGVGDIFTSTILAYSTKKFPKGDHPKTWTEFWDLKRFPVRRAYRNNPYESLEFALLADGVPMDKLYPLDGERAFRSLDRIKKQVAVWWTTGAQPPQLLVDGEVDLSTAWNGRIAAVMQQGAPVAIEWNQGMLSWQNWVIPRGSRNRDAAMKFIAFAIQPRQQASAVRFIPYGPTNKKAFDLIPPEIARNLPTAPENVKKQFIEDVTYWGENLPKVTERWNAWFIK